MRAQSTYDRASTEGHAAADDGAAGKRSRTERLPVQRKAAGATSDAPAPAQPASPTAPQAGDDPFGMHLAADVDGDLEDDEREPNGGNRRGHAARDTPGVAGHYVGQSHALNVGSPSSPGSPAPGSPSSPHPWMMFGVGPVDHAGNQGLPPAHHAPLVVSGVSSLGPDDPRAMATDTTATPAEEANPGGPTMAEMFQFPEGPTQVKPQVKPGMRRRRRRRRRR